MKQNTEGTIGKSTYELDSQQIIIMIINLMHLLQTNASSFIFVDISSMLHLHEKQKQLECGPMPNVTAALPNVGGTLCSTSQSLADAHY